LSYYAKSIVALFFLASGVVAVLSMLALQGKSEHKVSGRSLRRTHRTAGIIFFVLTLVLGYVGLGYIARASGTLVSRATFHVVLGFALFIVLILKVAIARFYRGLIRFMPVMGLIVFSLAFLVFSTSAMYYFARYHYSPPSPEEILLDKEEPAERDMVIRGDAQLGAELFEQNCSICHYTDRITSGGGAPGLKDLMKREKLPSSGRPTTPENIEKAIRDPAGSMPAFGSLSDKEIADLFAYLQTL
jgi:cytochrome c2